ncbi:glutamate--cysteine ligase [bacterium]|nr:glutamate--cysteine ligase [bacterium]
MPLHLFDAFGVELEYMVVDAATLDVRPIVDWLFEQVAGGTVSDVEHGDIDWSNELVRHVVELKTAQPAKSLAGLAGEFQRHVTLVNSELQSLNARLMPSAMHPWMDPHRELQLWPHDNGPIYETFHRVFDCRGHGWANLQSVHLNLPFCGAESPDDEFGRLHAAVRLLLPILPGLAASSPVIDQRLTGLLDNRLEVYRTNSRKVASIAGRVIPERAFTQHDYERLIFEPMFAEIAPFDPEGILQDEFLNARGAIARFGRGSIEIRVLDIQECPAADVAVLSAIVNVLRALVDERWSSLAAQQTVEIDPLYTILDRTIRDADRAVIDDAEYLRLLGWAQSPSCSVADLWRSLVEETGGLDGVPDDVAAGLQLILDRGPLARRLIDRLAGNASRAALTRLYTELCECLASGRMFE